MLRHSNLALETITFNIGIIVSFWVVLLSFSKITIINNVSYDCNIETLQMGSIHISRMEISEVFVIKSKRVKVNEWIWNNNPTQTKYLL